jgi:hypothetical protein
MKELNQTEVSAIAGGAHTENCGDAYNAGREFAQWLKSFF